MTQEENRLNQSIKLSDGRKLSYAEFGDLDGKTLFYFSGFPGSRLEANMIHEKAEENGLRVVSVDRPGTGRSSFKPNRQILDWSQDIIELAEHLKLSKFGVVGISVGAAYALSCAYTIPEKLSLVTTIGAFGAVDFSKKCMRGDYRFAFKLASYSKFLFRSIFWFKRARYLRKIELCDKLCESIKNGMAERDANMLSNPKIKEMVFASQNEACRQGLKGLIYEGKLIGQSWNIPFNQIDENLKIFLWHGSADSISPVSSSEELSQKIPGSSLRIFPDEGHYSVALNHSDEILNTLKKYLKN
jgi:pimeloyl-ACP methyl ester carboxylesterase